MRRLIIVLIVLAVALVFGVGMHFAFPQFTDNTVKAAGSLTTSMLERIAGMAPPPEKSSLGTEKQARFTALEGGVKMALHCLTRGLWIAAFNGVDDSTSSQPTSTKIHEIRSTFSLN